MPIARLKTITVTSLLLVLAACSSPAYHKQMRSTHIDKTKIIDTARAQLGVDYRYGGESPTEGFDCSGLVFYSYQLAGIRIPRTTRGQLQQARPISKHQLNRGDLLFFRIYQSRVSHVGIYLGGKRFIHAPATGKSVSIARLDTPYWQKRFIRGGRIYN